MKLKTALGSKTYWIIGAVVLVAIALISYGFYRFHKQNVALQTRISDLESENAASEVVLASSTAENESLSEDLTAAKTQISDFQKQVKNNSETIDTLQKYKDTDKELLEKYSKVFFLNENYVPSKLATITPEYTIDPSKPLLFHADVMTYLDRLIENAADDGVDLRVLSAYRSFGTQATLKASYKVTYGAGTANSFSADQGYSEHQLGTTVDFSTPTIGASLTTAFEKDKAYTWLTENAHRYGFILSYPKGNAYYQYEPWHWRFVGVDLARKLYRDKKYFYDLDQREIDEYLTEFFD